MSHTNTAAAPTPEYIGTATYSPEDNKLRIYPFHRLSTDDYNRVKAAGFSWAPKQELFVAPMWTPDREDLCLELCGELDDEDTSLSARAEERSERFDEYAVKREAEGDRVHASVSAITDGIPFGQPILVGHHSERRARKDAQRIDNGMRRAMQLFDMADYWQRRAASALAHAQYKELPAVRYRRIKGLESELRKQERYLVERREALETWSQPGLTQERATTIAGFSHYGFYLPRIAGDNPDFDQRPSAYAVLSNSYPNLYAPRTLEYVIESALKVFSAATPKIDRWIAHYQNRIAYERAMLGEGETSKLVGERAEFQVGGTVTIGRDGDTQLTILRVNKKDGVVCSLTLNRRYVRVVGIEDITSYTPPSEEQAAKIKAAVKLPPLCNYDGAEFAKLTQAQWDALPKDYKGSRVEPAGNGYDKHRLRYAIGTFLRGSDSRFSGHNYYPVFITDAKVKMPGALA
jgi:hypothetical protein